MALVAKSLPDNARGAGDTGSIPGEPDGLQFMELQRVRHNRINFGTFRIFTELTTVPQIVTILTNSCYEEKPVPGAGETEMS